MFRRLLAAVGLCSTDTPASLAAANARRGELSASAIAVESAAATHELTVEGYSRAKALLATGSYARSRTFAAGGHRWRILYFSNGEVRDDDDCIAVYLKLEQPPPAADVMARYSFSLLDHAGEPVPWCCANTTGSVSTFNTRTPIRGYRCFVEKKVLEASAYLRDDSFRIRCVIVVFGNEISTEDRDAAAAAVGLAGAPPPPDIGRHLGGLLSGGEGADVTFDVGGEMFHAHRYILAARSPVFKAELFGPMKEKNAGYCIPIKDMDTSVFKVLLYFIYTDSLPDMEEDDMLATYQHLLVAADRYSLERLKVICEGKLCSLVDASSVVTTLVLADRHGCNGLKKACFQFLMSPSNVKEAMATVI